MSTTTVSAELIRVSTKKLRKLSDKKIAQYMRDYDRGDSFPPIIVEDNGNFYTINDGRHRYQAQLRAGYSQIEVTIR